MPIFLAGFGLVFVLIGLTTLINDQRRRRAWLPRSGVITRSRFASPGNGLQFLVEYEDNGERIEFWNRFTSGTGFDPVGRQVDILANPNDPTDAVVVHGPGRPMMAGVAFLAFGLLATTIGMLLH